MPDINGFWIKVCGLLLLWSHQGYLIGWIEAGPNPTWGKEE